MTAEPVAPPQAVSETMDRLGIELRPDDVIEPKGGWGNAWLIRRVSGEDLFVKLSRSSEPAHIRMLSIETAALRLSDGTPDVIAADERALVSTAASDHSTAQTLADEISLSTAAAAELGTLAAAIHRDSKLAAGLEADGPLIEAQDHVTPETLAAGPGFEFRQYLAFIHADAAVRAAYRERVEGWTPACPIHGDLKTDNVLIGPGGDVVVIDWELSRLGDPRWDLGQTVGSLLMSWLRSVRPVGGDDVGAWLAGARVPLGAVTPLIGAFLDAYDAADPPRVIDREADLQASMGFAGIYLQQRALASLGSNGRIGRAGWCGMYTGASMLTRPARAVELFAGVA